jgi:hypothetical protein
MDTDKHGFCQAMDLACNGGRFSLSAFCGVGGAKWGEGRGEVPRFAIIISSVLSVSIRG